MWIPYIIFREAYLQSIRDYVSQRPAQANWIACHETGGVIPNIPGC